MRPAAAVDVGSGICWGAGHHGQAGFMEGTQLVLVQQQGREPWTRLQRRTASVLQNNLQLTPSPVGFAAVFSQADRRRGQHQGCGPRADWPSTDHPQPL